MKTLLFIFLLTISMVAGSQEKYFTRSGFIGFYSHTALEDIKAENKQVSCLVDTKTGEMLITALMKSFKFERALMEEHFNENYIESDKFPKATFKGKITNFSAIDFTKNGIYDVEVQGTISIHGVEKEIKSTGTAEIKSGHLILKSKLLINPLDYKIEIPSFVREKIAENMDVTVDLNLEPYQKK